MVTVIFADSVDVYFARQQVLERLIEAREQVPENVEITMGPVSTRPWARSTSTPLKAGTRSRRRTRDDFDPGPDRPGLDSVPLLKGIPGVNEVNSFGGYLKQYHVTVNPEKLLAYDLTLGEVGDSLKRNNLNVGGNILERGERQYLVRGIGLLQTIGDMVAWS